MNVVHVITGLGQGGAEASLYRLVTALSEDHRHIVVSLIDRGLYGPLLRELGVEVIEIGFPRSRITGGGLVRLGRTLRALQPAVVQTWMYHADIVGGCVARIAGGFPVVWGIRHAPARTDLLTPKLRLVTRVGASLSKWVPEVIVANSRAAVRVHRSIGYADRFVVIPNGIDTELFRPDAHASANIRRELGIQVDIPVLGMVARWHPNKDHATLIAALGILRKKGVAFHCLLAGTGITSENVELRQLLDYHAVRSSVVLLGPRQDIPAVMNALDIHALSSAAESFPNVLLEAMACGTPCVATDVGDAAEIIGETGWIVPPGNPDAFASALIHAMDAAQSHNAAERRTKSRDRIVSQFSVGRMANSFAEVWTSLNRQTKSGGGN